MLVATFGPSTGWSGKTITHENGQFVLQDCGPISAAQVLEYDRVAPLTWSTEGTRAWVGSLARSGPPAAPLSSACRFDLGHYVGGHPDLGPAVDGTLWVTTEYVGIQPPGGDVVAALRMGLIAAIGVHGAQATRSGVSATVRIGAFRLGAKDAEKSTLLVASIASGASATYAIDRPGPAQVRAALGPVLVQAGVPFAEAAPAPTAPTAPGTIDEVERLATLHAEGAITDTELRARLQPVFTQSGAPPVEADASPPHEAEAAPISQAAIDAALERLTALRLAGSITDAEHAAMKAKLVG